MSTTPSTSTTAAGNEVLFEVRDNVAVITLNRPQRHNAFNDTMSEELRFHIREADAHRDVRAILLRGEGPSFCSGRDTALLGARHGGETDFEFVRRSQQTRTILLDSPRPVIVAMKGHTYGGGLEVALAGDVRIAATTLSCGFPESVHGLVVDTGGSALATALIGPARAKYLLMTGDRIDAHTALSWGLVEFVVEPEELEERAWGIASRLARMSPLAVQMSKQLVDNQWDAHVRSALRSELMAQTALFTSQDRVELKAARAEGRDPHFEGR
ncbi:MAG: enoyl-CoA hydratase/isomerase family protein [Acidimicrobiia bacterium]